MLTYRFITRKMKFKMLIFLQLALAFLSNSVDGIIIRFTEERLNGMNRQDRHNFISCGCEGFNKTTVPLPSSDAEQIFNGILNHSFCGQNYPRNLCDLLEVCKNCTVQFEKCSPEAAGNNRSGDGVCIRKLFEMREQFSRTDVSNFLGDTTNNSRVKRQPTGCPYPTNMKTSDVACTFYPSSVKCQQKCIFGHTLEEGTMRQLQCSKSENVWKPSGFKECQPYIDCSVTLVSTGTADCYTATAISAPICDITCESYEDLKGVPKSSYQCKKDGSWHKRLPFCVIPGTGLELVPPPGSQGDKTEITLKPDDEDDEDDEDDREVKKREAGSQGGKSGITTQPGSQGFKTGKETELGSQSGKTGTTTQPGSQGDKTGKKT